MATGIEKIGITANGAVVYWRAADTSRERLRNSLDAANLGDLMPEPREPHAVLKSTLGALARANRTVDTELIVIPKRHAEQTGYEVHRVKKDEIVNDVSYVASFKTDSSGVEPLVERGVSPWNSDYVRAQFQYQANHVNAASVGVVLVSVVRHLGGVVLRPAGGVYWVPEESLPQLDVIAKALNDANEKIKVYAVRTVLDAAAVEALRDALLAEVEDITKSIKLELAENKLGKRAIKTRQQNAKYLHERVERYEKIFDEGLEALHAAVAETELELEAATVLEDHESVEIMFGFTDEGEPWAGSYSGNNGEDDGEAGVSTDPEQSGDENPA